jgi:hypothetical protein
MHSKLSFWKTTREETTDKTCVWRKDNFKNACEISSSHGGEYEVQNCLLGCTAV